MTDGVNHQHRRRKSIRLKGYDYSQSGAYFVTICAFERAYLFGDVADGVIQLNEFGEIAAQELLKTPAIRSEVELDAFMVMPNHIHAILLFDKDDGVGAHGSAPRQQDDTVSSESIPEQSNAATDRNPVYTATDSGERAHIRAPLQQDGTVSSEGERAHFRALQRPPRSLGSLVAQYKGAVTARINTIRRTPGLAVWQRNYYEHVIRDDRELNLAREYILNNPLAWTLHSTHAAPIDWNNTYDTDLHQ